MIILFSDLSMILCDPFSIHTIATSSIKVMQQLMSSEKLPRVSVNTRANAKLLGRVQFYLPLAKLPKF